MGNKLYKQIPDGHHAVIMYPNVKAFITGISQIAQDNLGVITVVGIHGEKYVLENTGEDIQADHAAETELALAYRLMPFCKSPVAA